MKKFRFAALVLLFLVLLPTAAYAHPGDTDSSGGHYDSSTGEYHYHHGYPAHQHTNGQCPYDFDDQTGWNSGSSGSSSGPPIEIFIPLVIAGQPDSYRCFYFNLNLSSFNNFLPPIF